MTYGEIISIPFWLFLIGVVLLVLGVISIVEHFAALIRWAWEKKYSMLTLTNEVERRRADVSDRRSKQ